MTNTTGQRSPLTRVTLAYTLPFARQQRYLLARISLVLLVDELVGSPGRTRAVRVDALEDAVADVVRLRAVRASQPNLVAVVVPRVLLVALVLSSHHAHSSALRPSTAQRILGSTLWITRTPVTSLPGSIISPMAPSTSLSQNSSRSSPFSSVHHTYTNTYKLSHLAESGDATRPRTLPLRTDHSPPRLFSGSSHSGAMPSLKTAKDSTVRSANFLRTNPSKSTSLHKTTPVPPLSQLYSHTRCHRTRTWAWGCCSSSPRTPRPC